jgi:curved DNA-binding protein CbpA
VQLKDYYKVLDLPPTADPGEIRKAYRRLALQYHPDKNADNMYAITRFAAIKEAYETLTNPIKKEQYLQQRWYAKSTGNWQAQEIVDPITIFTSLLNLEKYVSRADVNRMDKGKVYDQLHQILSDEALVALRDFSELQMNEKIIALVLTCCRPLPHELNMSILKKLENIEASDSMRNNIARFNRSSIRNERWERWQFVFVLLAVAALCVIIYLSSQ